MNVSTVTFLSFHRSKFLFFFLFIALFVSGNISLAQTLAFPTAEGFGAYSKGGRGGDVYHVTNINDDGSGSLRYGIEKANGPRTIVFDVSGTIKLKDRIKVDNDYLTIAGQTAPGDGICLRDNLFQISANHIIIRYIRVRLGDVAAVNSDAISITSGENIIVDHCSAGWSVDEVLSCSTGDKKAIHKVTVQWCIISEALDNSLHSKGSHGYGALIRGNYGAQYSYIHNLFAHNKARNPRPGNYDDNPASDDPLGLQFDFRNNVIYNWGGSYAGYDSDDKSVCRMNYVGNYLKLGSNSRTGVAYKAASPNFKGYFSGNYYNGKIPSDPWSLVSFSSAFSSSEKSKFKQSQPFSTGPVKTLSAQEAYTSVIDHAGASYARDAADERVINDVKNGKGSAIDSQNEVGGWPELKSSDAPKDSDKDGMPDEWENENGFNPNNGDDGNDDKDNDGYTNLEEYLNEIIETVNIPVSSNSLTVNSGSGDGDHSDGIIVNISADPPQSGYVFDKWTGDIANIANVNYAKTTIIMPSKDITIKANYIISNSSFVYYQAEDGVLSSGISIESDEHLGYNGTGYANFPAEGSIEFKNVDGGLGGNSTLTIRYALGNLSRTGDLIVNGSSQSLTMKQTSAWDDWTTIDISVSLNTGINNTIIIESTGADLGNLDEIVIEKGSVSFPTYSLTVNQGSGDGNYNESLVVNLIADTPPNGFVFEKWTGDVANITKKFSMNTTITMPASNVNITAIYGLEILTPNTLTVNGGSGSGDYSQGKQVNISANSIPSGMVFEKWSGDIEYLENFRVSSTTVIIPGKNIVVTANYKYLDQPTIVSILSVNIGTGSGQYFSGSVVNIAANDPPAGQVFSKWIGNTDNVNDVYSASTFVTIHNQQINIVATYMNDNSATFIDENNTGIKLNSYPNPFNDFTTIKFSLKTSSAVHFALYNLSGEQVYHLAGQFYALGMHEFVLSGVNLKSGIYLFKLNTNEYFETIPLIVK